MNAAFTPRARRAFWALLIATTAALAWLWDQTTNAPLVAGRAIGLADGVAAIVAMTGLLLLTRIAWKLSGRNAKEGGS